MQVERMSSQDGISGKRERNTLVTCPEVRNNPAKAGLIPDAIHVCRDVAQRRKSPREGPMVHQLVGRVMAYQGYDG